MSLRRAQTRGTISLPVRETLESSSTRQSQEMYLMPRNCWLRIKGLEIQPEKLQSGQKLRLRISVPNSTRTIRSSLIPIDDTLLASLSHNVDDSGYACVTLDITATCEYRHDIRFAHPSNLELELELLTAIINRTKSIGIATIDLAKAIQNPFNDNCSLIHDGKKGASIQVQVHSLNISRTIPDNANIHESIFLSDETSEIDSGPESVSLFTKAYASSRIFFVDMSTREGTSFMKLVSTTDSAIPVHDTEVIHQFFQFASSRPEQNLPIMIVGDDYFVSDILMRFLFMRDRGLLTNEDFRFFIIPLSPVNSTLVDLIGQASVDYTRNILSGEWWHIFAEGSDVQNADQMVRAVLGQLLESSPTSLDLVVGEVQVMTAGSEHVIPMILSLIVTSPEAKKGMANVKASFTTPKSTKSSTIKFHQMHIMPKPGQLTVRWSELASKLIPRGGDQQYDQKERNVIRMGVTSAKERLQLSIDGKPMVGVIGFTMSIRGPESAVKVWG